MNSSIADYVQHREAFRKLIDEDCVRRILLIEGKSGSGKTTLLAHCLHDVPADFSKVRADLKGSILSIGDFFYRVGNSIGWEELQQFQKAVASLQDTPHVQIDKNWLAGIGNRINVALHSEQDREQRRADLTNALFIDLARFGRKVLFIFDTFEQATSEMQAWINGLLLPRVTKVPNVRVVIAGREVPDPNNIDWGEASVKVELRGVSEPEHWIPVLRELNRRIEADDPKSYLKAICEVNKGDPDAIMKWLSALPRDGG